MDLKRTRLLLLFVTAALCLSACTQVKPPEATPDRGAKQDTTGLFFRITWTDYSGRGEAIEKIVRAYNKDRPAPITMIGGDENIETIQGMLDAKAPVIYVLPYRFVKHFGAKGDLLDLKAAFLADEAAFYPQIWDLGKVGGRTYGIPWLGHAMCLLYNKTLLDKSGVDAASISSLDALVHAMEQVEQHTDAKGIGLVGADSNDISWMVNQFIYGFGASLVSQDGASVAINDPRSSQAIAFYKDVLGAHAQASWLEDTGAEVMDHFRAQEVAFEIQGIWGLTDIQKNGNPFEVGVIALSDVGLPAEVGPMMLSLSASFDEAKKEEALAFIRYLISPAAQEQILLGEYSPEHDAYYPFRTPIRKDMLSDGAFRGYPEYIKFVEGFQNPSIDVPVPAWQAVKDAYYGIGLHKVMSGKMAVDDFLLQIQTEGNLILKNK
ncbi:MAG: ABC transporter substrate-binding protein [Christensenellales bacterium]